MGNCCSRTAPLRYYCPVVGREPLGWITIARRLLLSVSVFVGRILHCKLRHTHCCTLRFAGNIALCVSRFLHRGGSFLSNPTDQPEGQSPQSSRHLPKGEDGPRAGLVRCWMLDAARFSFGMPPKLPNVEIGRFLLQQIWDDAFPSSRPVVSYVSWFMVHYARPRQAYLHKIASPIYSTAQGLWLVSASKAQQPPGELRHAWCWSMVVVFRGGQPVAPIMLSFCVRVRPPSSEEHGM